MIRNRMHLRIAAAGVAAILLAPAPAWAGLIYSFDTIAKNGTSALIGSGPTTDVGSIIDISPGGASINDAGTVAFRALTNSISGVGGGIFTGNGGSLVTAIADSLNPSFPSFAGTPSINNGGTVTFLANLTGGGGGVFTGSGGPTTTVANNNTSTFAGIGSPSINNGGTVAFMATLDTGGGSGIYTRSGGSTATVAHSSGPLSGFGDPSINDGGTAAFRATLDAGGTGVFTGTGGATTTIASASYSGSGPFAFILGAPSINNGGTVAFTSLLNTGGEGVFTGNGGPTATVADTSGPYSDLRTPAINDAGTVVFLAALDAGGTGIFTGLDPALDKVIALGDPLGGSTVTNLRELRGDSINSLGQIAFSALLADGSEGIFRATLGQGPIVIVDVPEPATLALFALGLAGLSEMRRRHRRSG